MRRPPWRAALAAVLFAAHGATPAASCPADGGAASALAYWIDVDVDPRSGRLAGVQRVVWRNDTGGTVRTLPVQLWTNGFANGSTTWMAKGTSPATRFGRDGVARRWGNIALTDVRRVDAACPADLDGPLAVPDGERLSWQPVQPDDLNPFDRSLVHVTLASPVAAGEVAAFSFSFESQLPVPAVARTGCLSSRSFCMLGRWHPQLAGPPPPGEAWTGGQFHAGTEFFGGFADYAVRVTVPPGTTVLTSGRATGRDPATVAGGERRGEATVYERGGVHDFAMFVGEAETAAFSHAPADGTPVDVVMAWAPGARPDVARLRANLAAAMDVMTRRVGPLPYDTLAVVYPPYEGHRIDGQEYPALFTGLVSDPVSALPLVEGLRFAELVDIHELAHQYFQGAVATDERAHAFLDEGLTSYWEYEVARDLYGPHASGGRVAGVGIGVEDVARRRYEAASDAFGEAVLKAPAWLFRPSARSVQIYQRPAAVLSTARNLFGRDAMDRFLSAYYRRHAFSHPTPADFLDAAATDGGAELAAFLREALSKPDAPNYAVDLVRAVRGVPVGRYGRDGSLAPPDDDLWRRRAAGGCVGLCARIYDGGSHGGRAGGVARRPLEIVSPGRAGAAGETVESYVRLSGAAWETVPVDVVFTFADGSVARDRWRGGGAWRAYHIVHTARVTAVVIDPEQRIAIDADRSDNAWSAEPDPAASAALGGWSAFYGGLAAVLANGVLTWF